MKNRNASLLGDSSNKKKLKHFHIRNLAQLHTLQITVNNYQHAAEYPPSNHLSSAHSLPPCSPSSLPILKYHHAHLHHRPTRPRRLRPHLHASLLRTHSPPRPHHPQRRQLSS